MKFNSYLDSFVKIYMLYRGQRLDKKQTRIIENSSQPIYEQTFDFDLISLIQQHQPMDNVNYNFDSFDSTSTSNITTNTNVFSSSNSIIVDSKIASRIQFVLLVMDWDRVEKSDVIGKIELSTQHRQQKLFHIQTMENNSNTTTTNYSSFSIDGSFRNVETNNKIDKPKFFRPRPKLNKFMRLNEIETCVDDEEDFNEENSIFNSNSSQQRYRKRRFTNESESPQHSISVNNNNSVHNIQNESLRQRQHNWYDIFYEPNVPIMCTYQIDNF